jgi:regulator of replication initiation timing
MPDPPKPKADPVEYLNNHDSVVIIGRINRVEAKVNGLAALLTQLLGLSATQQQELETMAGELDQLKTQVQKTTDAEDAAALLLKGLKDRLDAAIASGDPKELKRLSSALGKSTDDLAAAVVANTPAEPEEPGPGPASAKKP